MGRDVGKRTRDELTDDDSNTNANRPTDRPTDIAQCDGLMVRRFTFNTEPTNLKWKKYPPYTRKRAVECIPKKQNKKNGQNYHRKHGRRTTTGHRREHSQRGNSGSDERSPKNERKAHNPTHIHTNTQKGWQCCAVLQVPRFCNGSRVHRRVCMFRAAPTITTTTSHRGQVIRRSLLHTVCSHPHPARFWPGGRALQGLREKSIEKRTKATWPELLIFTVNCRHKGSQFHGKQRTCTIDNRGWRCANGCNSHLFPPHPVLC